MLDFLSKIRLVGSILHNSDRPLIIILDPIKIKILGKDHPKQIEVLVRYAGVTQGAGARISTLQLAYAPSGKKASLSKGNDAGNYGKNKACTKDPGEIQGFKRNLF